MMMKGWENLELQKPTNAQVKDNIHKNRLSVQAAGEEYPLAHVMQFQHNLRIHTGLTEICEKSLINYQIIQCIFICEDL